MFKLLQKQLFITLFIGFITCLSTPISAQNLDPNLSKDTLVVGIAGSEPFVMQSNPDQPEGIAIDIWQNLADKAEWNYRYKSFGTVKQALDAVKKGKVDLVVGPISITSERLEDMSFSQPYFQSSLSLVSRNDELSLLDRIKPLFSLKLLLAVAGFLFILAFVGTLFWLAEHKKSPDQFSPKFGKGVGNGMWLAIVTMSTVGYGDMAPRTALGRIIAGTWIVLAIIFATSMVAGIASVLSLSANSSSTIANVEQLSSKKAATIGGSPAVSFIKEHKSKVVAVKSLEEGMDLLNDGKVEAVVYDRPELEYYINNHKDEDLYLANAEYYKQGYGFAFPQNSTLVYQVNLKLLNLAENQEVRKIVNQFLGEDN